MRKPKEQFGPDKMSNVGRKKFFGFYKIHEERALAGFVSDIGKSTVNQEVLNKYLGDNKKINCLVMGCSHWKNPQSVRNFLATFNKSLSLNLAVLDVLPDAILEVMERQVDCIPVLAPAQKTPFLDKFFDIIVCDCLLTCCSFDQHEPVVKEISRLLKKGGLLILGVVHSEKNLTFKMLERPIMNYCRPLADYKKLFSKYGLVFVPNSAVETLLPGQWNHMKILNGLVKKK